jgi:hypothetical protein
MRQWIPEIRERFEDTVVEKQEPKLLPTEPYPVPKDEDFSVVIGPGKGVG